MPEYWTQSCSLAHGKDWSHEWALGPDVSCTAVVDTLLGRGEEWSSAHEEIFEYFNSFFSVAFQRRYETVCRLLNASTRQPSRGG
jgi:hypothetical protein